MNESLAPEYKASIDKAKAVSFDVFDTLIHRITFRPTHLFDLLSKRLYESDLALHHPKLIANFSALRVTCEVLARKRHHDKHGTYEISLRDIYDTLQNEAGIHPELVDALIAEEVVLERASVFPNKLMMELYNHALENKKKVVLCSDMYLPASEIEALLIEAGYTPPFQLFVSGELKKSKHEGTLFPYVCGVLGIKPDELVHFGDNLHADYEKPLSAGIAAHHFHHVQTRTEAGIRKIPSEETKDNDSVIGLIKGVIRRSLLEKHETHDFWFDIGLQVFGPLFLGKYLWLTRQLQAKRSEKILFFARDAHFHHDMHVTYGGLFGLDIPADYVYLSRASTLVPSLTELNLDRTWHLFSGKTSRTVSGHLNRLGINPQLVKTEIQQVGFDSMEDIAKSDDTRMLLLLNLLHPYLLANAKEQRSIVMGYLDQIVGDVNRIAVVDIGWAGNMQSSFSRLLQLKRNDYEINGYYYGTLEQIALNHGPRDTFHSYLVKQGQPSAWQHQLFSGGIELLEFAHMAPHGTTLGYEEDKHGKIIPVLENNRVDILVQGMAQQVQHGARTFIEIAMPIVRKVGIKNLVSTDWALPFFRLVSEPNNEEAEFLGELTHSDSATDTLKRLPLAPKVASGSFGFKGKAYREAYDKAYWKSGFIVRNS